MSILCKSVLWAKVWRDLTHNKARTLLAVLSTSVGVFALGLTFGLSSAMRTQMTADHQSRIPGHINFWTSSFDQEIVETIRQEPGVSDAEAQTHTSLHWKLAGETEWREGNLVARAQYEAQRMDLIDLVDGHWPTDRTLAPERQSSEYFAIPIGATVVIERGRREQQLPITGIVRMPIGFFSPPQIGGDATFFATPETVAWLTGDEGFNQLNVRLESFDEQAAQTLAAQIQRRLEHAGVSISSHSITDPDVHWLQDQADTLFLILDILGGLSLGLSTFLIINTTNAIVARQVWQIGVMKVLGATSAHVMHIYLAAALAYGMLALLLAVPSGAVAAHWMASWLLDLMGIAGGAFRITPTAVGIQIAVGISAPLLAALAPVIGGARVTPRQAISSYGLGSGFGQGPLDHLAGRIHRLPRAMALSLRNTFRRKARTALTLITLILSGAMFVTVMSVSNSLNNTLEAMLDTFGFDILVRFSQPHRAVHLVKIAESAPDVIRAEAWDYQRAILKLANGEGREFPIWGLPPDSTTFHPRITSGRAPLSDDGRAILLNSQIAADEEILVGDEIELEIGRKEALWKVVGLVLSVSNNQLNSFALFDVLTREAGNANRGTLVVAVSGSRDFESHEALMKNLYGAYTARRVETTLIQSAGKLREQNRTQFAVITSLMLAMTILAALVGNIGLTGVMLINMVERRREIGVMRAIGATSATIANIFVGEGTLLGMWSWLCAVPLSIPGARLFSRAVGNALFQLPLDFRYSTHGMLLWLLIVIALSALASLWPALRATQISVREALAYE
jgi:putative ABC transport system permease protein